MSLDHVKGFLTLSRSEPSSWEGGGEILSLESRLTIPNRPFCSSVNMCLLSEVFLQQNVGVFLRAVIGSPSFVLRKLSHKFLLYLHCKHDMFLVRVV